MTTPWEDFGPKLVLTIVDKAILGGVFAVATYWLQKQLERFKRDQTLISEVAKERIKAYHRIFTLIAEAGFACDMAWAILETSLRTRSTANINLANEKLLALKSAAVALQEGIVTDGFLLANAFSNAAWEYRMTISKAVEDLHGAAKATNPKCDEHFENYRSKLNTISRVMISCLPPFARVPGGDVAFQEPHVDIDSVIADVGAAPLAPKHQASEPSR